jgi:hypothetical protein
MNGPNGHRTNNGDDGFRRTFRHHITGKVMDAADYGYKSWPPFGRKKRKRKK